HSISASRNLPTGALNPRQYRIPCQQRLFDASRARGSLRATGRFCTGEHMPPPMQPSHSPSPASISFTRRALLRGGALVISGALFPGAAFGQASNRAGAVSLTAWVKITTDNRVTLVASQSEMGQGTTTTLAAALADEL